MTRFIWIVRHGERIDNIDPKWKNECALAGGDWDDPPLTLRGMNQTKEAGVKLAQEGQSIDHVFSSPFTRCLQSTQHILKGLAGNKSSEPNKVLIEPGFCESLNNCQNPPGFMEIDEIKTAFQELDIDHKYRPLYKKETLPDESTDNCCFARVRETLAYILHNYPKGNMLIVSHGSPIAGCHFAFTGDYKYVGQATISKYELKGTHCDASIEKSTNPSTFTENTKENLIDKNLLICGAIANSDKLGNAKLIIDGSILSNPKSPAIASQKKDIKKPLEILSKQQWKCLLAGDSSHLSDPQNLRDHA